MPSAWCLWVMRLGGAVWVVQGGDAPTLTALEQKALAMDTCAFDYMPSLADLGTYCFKPCAGSVAE